MYSRRQVTNWTSQAVLPPMKNNYSGIPYWTFRRWKRHQKQHWKRLRKRYRKHCCKWYRKRCWILRPYPKSVTTFFFILNETKYFIIFKIWIYLTIWKEYEDNGNWFKHIGLLKFSLKKNKQFFSRFKNKIKPICL